jgi:uncharacterized protein (DUF433 family)
LDFSLYGGHDPRELPAYPLDIAHRFLLLPKSILKAWVFGAKWREKTETGFRLCTFDPIIEPPTQDDPQQMLSFVNLVEAHVLKAVRRKHLVNMAKVRDTIEQLKRRYATRHPLADVDLLAAGGELFIHEYGALLNISMGRQVAMDFLRVYLSRIERDVDHALRLFPFVVPPLKIGKEVIEQDGRLIAIDPFISFGRPVIAGTGIPTESIASRFWGGDSIDDLIRDFGRTKTEIEFALRYENAQLQQAAG